MSETERGPARHSQVGIAQQVRRDRQAAARQQQGGPEGPAEQAMLDVAFGGPAGGGMSSATIPLSEAPADVQAAINADITTTNNALLATTVVVGGPGVPTVVDSASEARTTNNVMRHEYRVLSDVEKAQMKEIKDAGLDFINMLEDIGGTRADPNVPPRMASRELSIAQTKMEEAVMWAVKHITR